MSGCGQLLTTKPVTPSRIGGTGFDSKKRQSFPTPPRERREQGAGINGPLTPALGAVVREYGRVAGGVDQALNIGDGEAWTKLLGLTNLRTLDSGIALRPLAYSSRPR